MVGIITVTRVIQECLTLINLVLHTLQPFLVGKAVIPLRKWLGAHSLSTQCQLDVRACSLADASGSRGVSTEDAIAGNLQVCHILPGQGLIQGGGGGGGVDRMASQPPCTVCTGFKYMCI